MLLLSFMAETRDHDRYAKDFVDVALIHDVGVEPQLEDDLLLLLLLCDVALSTGLKIRSCCISWVQRKVLYAKAAYGLSD